MASRKMTAPSTRLTADDFRQRRRNEARERDRVLGMLATVVAALAIVLGTIALVRYYQEPEAVFEVPPKQIRIPPKPPEHRMNVAKHEAARPKPTFTRKLLSSRPTEVTLPDLPQVDLDQMLPLDPSQLVSDQVTSLMGSSGIGNGLGNGLLGSGGTGDGMGFLGIRAEGNRILLLFDVSLSVVNKADQSGLPFSKIREQTIQALEALPVNARFGLVQFTRNFKPFRKELVVATQANKEAARQWIQEEWTDSGGMSASEAGVLSPSPNGIEAVLEFAFALDPDVIYLISDASFQRSPDNVTVDHDAIGDLIDSLQSNSSARGGCQIHFIGFGVREDDERTMKRIVRRNRGEYKDIE